MLASGVVG